MEAPALADAAEAISARKDEAVPEYPDLMVPEAGCIQGRVMGMMDPMGGCSLKPWAGVR